MPFDHRLFGALQPGKTLAEDKANSGYTSAKLEPAAGETVLLFRLDNDQTRKQLSLSGKKCCDYFFLYRTTQKSLLIFVELKGTSLDRVEEQLSGTIDAICDGVTEGRIWRSLVRAVIVSPNASPRDRLKIQRAMKPKGIKVYFGSSKRNAPCSIRAIEGLSDDFKK